MVLDSMMRRKHDPFDVDQHRLPVSADEHVVGPELTVDKPVLPPAGGPDHTRQGGGFGELTAHGGLTPAGWADGKEPA